CQGGVMAVLELDPEEPSIAFLVADIDESVLYGLKQVRVPPEVSFFEPASIAVHPLVMRQRSVDDLSRLRAELLDAEQVGFPQTHHPCQGVASTCEVPVAP